MIKRVVLRFFLVVVAAALTFCGLETFLYLINYKYVPLKIKYLDKNDHRFHNAFEDVYLEYDSNLIWRPKKNYKIFNSYGLRGKEIDIKKNPSEIRIFALGDSNTAGWKQDTRNGANWPLFLEKLLIRTNKNIVVENAGVWGYTTYQGLQRLKEILIFKPDIVLVCFGSNDALRVTISDEDFVNGNFIRKIKWDKKLIEFKTGQLFIHCLDNMLKKTKKKKRARVSLNEYRRYFEEMIKICNDNNILMVIITRPYIGECSDPDWWKTFGPDYIKETKNIAVDNNIFLVEMYDYFKDKENLFADESHFTVKGHEIAAQFVYNLLMPLIENKR